MNGVINSANLMHVVFFKRIIKLKEKKMCVVIDRHLFQNKILSSVEHCRRRSVDDDVDIIFFSLCFVVSFKSIL